MAGESTGRPDRPAGRPPPPPAGQSPTLAWHWDPWRPRLLWWAGIVVLLLVLTIANPGWITKPAAVCVVVAAVLLVGLLLIPTRIAAGRDWFRRGRHWVRTDELVSVSLLRGGAYGQSSLGMTDAAGRSASIRMFQLTDRPEMHRLVVDAVRSSVARGATTDRAARKRFRFLPDRGPS